MNDERPKIDGYCEMHGDVVQTTIYLNEDDDFTWYTSGDLNDYSQHWDEYMKICGGKLYLSLQDYKQDEFIDLDEWRKNASKKNRTNTDK